MFHRRLLLLAILMLTGLAIPGLQLARLTLVKGEELRQRAESRLSTQRYIPASRGRILDRKGRVLAMDRPSYDIALDYSVISGQWAYTEAAKAARKSQGRQWTELNSAQRERLVQEQLPLFQTVLEEAWRHLSRLSGVPMDQLEYRKSEIIRSVQLAESRLRENERSALERQKRDEAMARGEELAQEIEVASADIKVEIRERTIPHVMIRGVNDEAAFRFISIAESARGGAAAPGVPVIPGLHVIDASAREYPGDRVGVKIDRSSFPGPIRSLQPLDMEVRGVATNIVGWMRSTIYPEDLELRRDDSLNRPAQDRLDRPAMIPVSPPSAADPSGTSPALEPDLGFYMQGDSVGSAGVERSAEGRLRGARGVVREQLDTGSTDTTPHVPGSDVPLTIDVQLQARIQGLLDPRAGLAVVQGWHGNKAIVPDPASLASDPKERVKTIELGTPLSAAVVVIDVDTGDILALVSSPTMSHDELAGMDPEQIRKLIEDPVGSPLKNRAIAEAYPPGSIVKPLMYLSAVSSGVVEPGVRIACHGVLYPEKPQHFRCWIYKQFNGNTHSEQLGGELSASDALMVSCNIFFYTLGRTMGPERIIDWYGRFGVGSGPEIKHPRLGIGAQFTGLAGDSDGAAHTSQDEATLMGMGQGPVAWTPLHAADAYSTLARGGVRILPRIRADVPQEIIDLKLDRRAIPIMLDGLKRAVTDERGSANHITVVDELNSQKRENTFNCPGVTVWGKSGTADAPAAIEVDPKSKLRKLVRDGDHSWCVALVGPAAEAGKPGDERPRYAIAAVVEYGGSGGRVAGPVVNQVVHALVAEGYLPAVSKERPGKPGHADAEGAGAGSAEGDSN